LVVVGAGLVGLATAYAHLELYPGSTVTVLDKEQRVAVHQSGRNSGVVHTGLYYAPGSLKAALCRDGRRRLLEFADAHKIPYRLVGKVVVARDVAEIPRLEELARRGRANGLVGLRELDGDGLREIEPNVVGVRAIHVPETAVIDFRLVASALADEVRRAGGEVLLGHHVVAIERRGRARIVRTDGGESITARAIVVCGGIQADRLLRLAGGDDGRRRIVPFRGSYYLVSPAAESLVRGLVYPVPDPSLPFLGVHFTRRVDGQLWVGPNAVPALAREGRRRFSFRPRDAFELLTYPGFWRFAGRHMRAGTAEIWRDLIKSRAVAEMRRYVPALSADDVTHGAWGIRAQVLAREGELVDDFLLERREDVLHVLNAPSPAATASLAIGRRIAADAAEGT
jgi:L-2-hydroxyglutarate oxidase LhgO